MRLYRISFAAGFVAGFVAGTRAGRERYDQMVAIIKTARENPAVQQAASTVQSQATSLLSSAGHKVAETAPQIAHKVEGRIPLLKQRSDHGSSSNGSRSGRPFAETADSSKGKPGKS